MANSCLKLTWKIHAPVFSDNFEISANLLFFSDLLLYKNVKKLWDTNEIISVSSEFKLNLNCGFIGTKFNVKLKNIIPNYTISARSKSSVYRDGLDSNK